MLALNPGPAAGQGAQGLGSDQGSDRFAGRGGAPAGKDRLAFMLDEIDQKIQSDMPREENLSAATCCRTSTQSGCS